MRLRLSEIPASGDQIILGNLPMFHAFGMVLYTIICLSYRTKIAKIVLLPRFIEREFLNCIQVRAKKENTKKKLFLSKHRSINISAIQSDKCIFGATNYGYSGEIASGSEI